jgi:predicted thioesterase
VRPGLLPGATARLEVVVDDSMLARFDTLGLVHPVYATWAVVKHMEEASRRLILPYLEPDEDAAGYRVEVVHLAPTPAGARVEVRATLEAVEGRRVRCRVEAYNDRGKVAEGFHEQVLVPRGWWMRRLQGERQPPPR